jgi:hypothetical protein
MTPEEFKKALADQWPKAADFPVGDLQSIPNASELAETLGYRLAGIRLGFAVFTTKERAAASALADKRADP